MSYGADSIVELSFLQGVRQRIQMYLGSDDIEGTYQAFKEILNNSTDEAIVGYGDKLDIIVNEKENSISVRDYGRGCPFLVKEDGTNVLIDIYTKAHVGGKFSEDSYKNVAGLNGVGGSCVCLSSEKFLVKSFRNGVKAEAYFEKGINISYKEEKTKEKNGTYVWFIPDKEVFKNGEIGFSFDRICKEIKNISFLYEGITFSILNSESKEEKIFCAKNGIIDFVKDEVKSPLHPHIIYVKETDGTDSIEIAFQWGVKKETPYTFVNGLCCPEHGVNLTGAKSAITRTFNSLTKGNFDSDNIRRNLFYVMNFKISSPSFANQTKSKINTQSARTLASKAFTTGLKEMYKCYPSDFNTVVTMLEKVEKAEAAAEKARNSILNYEKETIITNKKKMSAPIKLMDCEKHGQDSILYITEGKSAKTPVQNARNIKSEAVYDIRGKIISALKNPIDKVLENEEVKDILQILGCGILDKYNEKKLNFGKVLIFSDRDEDGSAISNLIVTLFYVLMPEFIKSGRLGRVIPPLFRMKKGKQCVYFYSNEEYLKEKHKYPNWEVTRYKGIGECSSADFKNTCFNEQEKRIHIYTVNDFTQFEETLNLLMGPEVPQRRDYIFENLDFHKLRSEV